MDINVLAVLVAGLAGFVVGVVWYMPQVFGKKWMKAVGLKEVDMKNPKDGMMGKMIISLVSTFVVALVLSHLMSAMTLWRGNMYGSADPVWVGLCTGALTWLGFLATSLVDPVLWLNKPWSLWMINASHWLVKLLVMGALLGLMK